MNLSSVNAKGDKHDAISLYKRMRAEEVSRINVVIGALKACRTGKDLSTAREIHKDVVSNGEISNIFVANLLLDVYSKCGSMSEAQRVFDRIHQRSVVSWNSIILGYAQTGHGQLALDFFQRMQDEGCPLTSVTLLAALKACSSLCDKQENHVLCLETGRKIHSKAGDLGIVQGNTFVANSLVDMYAKCGSIQEARDVFESIQCPSAVSWNCIIMGYTLDGQAEVAMELFTRMREQGCEPNDVTFIAAFKACACLAEKEQGREFGEKVVKFKCLERGRALHHLLTSQQRSTQMQMAVATALVDMYSKCGGVEDAGRVFKSMKQRDLVLWTTLIRGFAQNGEGEMALECYSRMQEEGFVPDLVAVLAALNACSSLALEGDQGRLVQGMPVKNFCLKKGREIHFQAARLREKLDLVAANALVDMYVKCGSMNEACKVFQSLQKRDVVSWTAMIQGYTQDGQEELALQMFWQMKREGCSPDDVAFVAAFQACAGLAEKEDGKLVDGKYLKLSSLQRGGEVRAEAGDRVRNLFVANAALDMYSKCWCLAEAVKLFETMQHRDVVSWTCMIHAYSLSGEGEQAMESYARMQTDQGNFLVPNRVTILAALKACANLADKEQGRLIDGKVVKLDSLQKGRSVHKQAVQLRQEQELFVGSSLVDFYSKCGSMDDARRVFDCMRQRDVVSWTSMVLGYAEAGEGETAMEFFTRMKQQGCPADEVSFVAALKACSRMGALEEGRHLHEQIRTAGFESSQMVANFLVDFYGKCGSMAEAKTVFDKMERRNVVSWSSLIAGYSYSGDAGNAVFYFERMQEQKMQPNEVTYLAVLAACTHAGLVEQGKKYFSEMVSKHGISRRVEHYTAMVDLLGRANRLDEAMALVEGMDCGGDAVLWMTLLGAAHNLKNLPVARQAFDAVVELDVGKVHVSAAYVLISNVYAAAGLKFSL